MAGSTQRAINMALRVTGIGEVERDFRRVAQSGEKAFAEVKKGANGAALEVSDYTARLRRATTEAKRLADSIPDLNKPTAQSRTNRNQFVLGAVKGEQERIMGGLPDLTRDLGAADTAASGFAGRLGMIGGIAAGAAVVLGGLALGVKESLRAFMEHEAALASFHANLRLAGNSSEATAAQIENMARRVEASTLQSAEGALKAGQALASVPGLTAEAMEEALMSSARLADALGVELPEIIESRTVPVLLALAEKDMPALVKATKGLDDRLRATILTLAEAGKTADAQRVLLTGLAEAAGEGSGGLAAAVDRLTDRWEGMKRSLGEDIATPATAMLNGIADALDWVSQKTAKAQIDWAGFMRTLAPGLGPLGSFLGAGATMLSGPKGGAQQPWQGGGAAGLGELLAKAGDFTRSQARTTVKDFETRYGGGGAKPRGRSGGGSRARSGKSDAEREAERLTREAERARDAADRITESNADVVSSWRQRVADIEATVGKEGAALDAVLRSQEIEAAVRRINTEEIEKQVEARRAEAAAAKQPFDQAAAYLAAAAAVGRTSEEVRLLAMRYVDAGRAVEDFKRRQAEALAIVEQTRTPFEAMAQEVGTLTARLKAGDITTETFNRRLDQLATDLGRVRQETDKTAAAWAGFGQDVGRTLADFVLDGGSALDVLQQLVRMPLERLLEQNLVNPVAGLIDGLTGNNADKNTAAARGELDALASELMGLTTPTAAAALGVGRMAQATMSATLSLQAFQQQLALGSVTGGGGGDLITALKIGASMFAGGGPSAGLVASVDSAIAANPALFASGTPSVPLGSDFFVGENGRERMRYHGGGRLEVISGPRTHREASGPGGGVTIVQNVSVPERADPRRTASTLARGTQQGLARATRKNVAAPAGRRR